MSYDYHASRPDLFTESGTAMLIKIRDNARSLLDQAGAFRWDHAVRGVSGNSWTMLAALDYLVEKGEVVLLTPNGSVPGQYQVYTRGPKA